MHMKIQNKLHPWWNDHYHDKPKGYKEYKRSPDLIVFPWFRWGSPERPFQHLEGKFKDHRKKKKAKQHPLHGREQSLHPARPFTINLVTYKKHTCIIMPISLLLLPYRTTSDWNKNPDNCRKNLITNNNMPKKASFPKKERGGKAIKCIKETNLCYGQCHHITKI